MATDIVYTGAIRDRRSGAVRLNIRDDALRVVFGRLDMARRYLAANATRKAIKVG